jgi:hypothetical protein
LHIRVKRILLGLVLGVYHRIQRATRSCESRASITRRVSPNGWDERQSKAKRRRESSNRSASHQVTA